MPVAVFGAAVLGGLLWFLFLLLALPVLLARLLSLLLSRATPYSVSLAALHVYPLAGAVVARGLRVASPDAVLEAREASATARWWRRSRPPDPARHASAAAIAFVVALDGVRARVVNNSAGYDALAAALAGGRGSDGSACAPAGGRGAPGPGGHDSLAAWVCSRTTVRVRAGALYVLDGVEGGGAVVRILADTAKVRYSALPPVHASLARRDAARAVFGRLRVGVVMPAAVVAGGGEQGAGGGGADGRAPPPCAPRLHQAEALCCVPILAADAAEVSCTFDELLPAVAGVDAGSSGSTPLVADVVAMLEGAHFALDQAALAAAQGVLERLSPARHHLDDGAPARDIAPLTLHINAVPKAGEPLLSLPFAPRESTWRALVALELRQWPGHGALRRRRAGHQLHSHFSFQAKVSGDPPAAAAESALEAGLPASSLNVFGSRVTSDICVPRSRSSPFRAEVAFHDVRVDAAGVVDAPLVRTARLDVTFSEPAQKFWNERRVGTVDAVVQSPRILYSMDCLRVLDDVAYAMSAHAHAPEDVRYFVPYELAVKVSSSTGYVVRICVQEGNSWPSMEHVLDDMPGVAIAELRGKVGSVSLASTATLEYSPLSSTTRWRAELPSSELFLMLPVPLPDSDGGAFRAAPGRGDRAEGRDRKSGSHDGRARSALPENVRNAVDAALSASRLGLSAAFSGVSGGVAEEARTGEGGAASDVVSCSHAIRIAHVEGGLSVSGEGTVYVADVPHAFDRVNIRVDCGRMVVDVNPNHAPYLFALVENVTGAVTHSLSFEERDRLRSRRRALERQLASEAREVTQLEALLLGLNGGQLGAHPSFAQSTKMSSSVEVEDLVLRLHDAPSAVSPFSRPPSPLSNVVRLGTVAISSQATKWGVVIEARPADPLAVASLGAAIEGRAGQACLTSTGWGWTRAILCDANGAPYSVQTGIKLGRLSGAITASNLLVLARFQASILSLPLPAVSPAIDALWTVSALSVEADGLDVLVPLCGSASMSAIPGVAHVEMERGVRGCINTLCTSAALGHNVFTLPSLSCKLYSPAASVASVPWEDGDRGVRKSIQECEARILRRAPPPHPVGGLTRAGLVAPTTVLGVALERPPAWSSATAGVQAQRLHLAESGVPRASYLWSSKATSKAQSAACEAGLGLYDVSWWRRAAGDRLRSASAAGSSASRPVTVYEIEGQVSVLGSGEVVVGPHALFAARRFLLHLLRQEGLLDRAGAGDVSEADLMSIWRRRSMQWRVDLEGAAAVKTRGVFSLQALSLVLLSPAELLPDELSSELASFRKAFAGDRVVVSLPNGLRCAAVDLRSPSWSPTADAGASDAPYTILLASIPVLTVAAASDAAVLRATDLDARLQAKAAAGSCAPELSMRLVAKSCRVSGGDDNLASCSCLGRVMFVYGLMVRAIGLELSARTERGALRRDSADASLRKVGARLCPGVICNAIYFLRSAASSAAAASTVDSACAPPDSRIVGQTRGGDVLWGTVVPVFLHALGRTPGAGGGDPSVAGESADWRSALSRAGALQVTMRLAVLEAGVLGQPVFRLCGSSFEGNARAPGLSAEDGVVKACFDTFSLSGRNDVIAGLLNAAASVASHVTKATSLLPELRDQDLLAVPSASEPAGEMWDLSDSERRPPASFGARGHVPSAPSCTSRATTAIHAVPRSPSRASQSNSQARDASRDADDPRSRSAPSQFEMRSPLDDCELGHRVGRVVATDGSIGGRAETLTLNPRTWLQKATRPRQQSAADSALQFADAAPGGGSGDGEGNAVLTGGAPPHGSVHGSDEARPSHSPAPNVSVLFSFGTVDLSYRHLGRETETSLEEPDLRMTLGETSGSAVMGSSSVFRSVVLVTRAMSMISRNEASCVFAGSVASIRGCASIASGSRATSQPTTVLSVKFYNVNLSLEAADIRSVQGFLDQFTDDIKSIGESLVAAIASVRAMLRATRRASPTASSKPPVDCGEPAFGDIALDIGVQDLSTSLVGFHPGDKSMHIAHEASSVFGSAALSEEAAAVLILGARVQGQSLVTSASHWSSEERFTFPGLDVCGVQWSHESELPTQLQMTAGPLVNVVSFQSVRNMLVAAAGLLAFQNDAGHDILPASTGSSDRAALPHVDLLEGSMLTRAISAWERTKAVRMDVRLEPMSIGLSSGAVMMTFDVGLLAGVVEWNMFLESGVQLRAALLVPVVSLLYARASSPDESSSARRENASLSIDFTGGRMDVLKSQSGVVHKFVFRLALAGIQSVVKPWQFMEDAAAWSDEQDFIKEIQSMHLGVAASTKQRSLSLNHRLDAGSPGAREPSGCRAEEHRLLEVGLEVDSALLHVPLLAEETVENCRLSIEFREFHLRARFGDEVALPSQLNLAKATIRSMGILWEGSDLFNSSQAEFVFAGQRSPLTAGAHFGSLRGSISLGSWVVCPRQEVVLAIVDARIARHVHATRRARAKLGSIPELLARAGSASVSGAPLHSREDLRLLFEHIEVLVQPSPGFIEGPDSQPTTRPSRARRAGAPASDQDARLPPRLHLPIPLFSVGFVRHPSHEFDLLDVNFSRTQHENFPDGCLGRVATLFSELFGAVASRTKIDPQPDSSSDEDDSVFSRSIATGGGASEVRNLVRMEGRDWSALVRFGESRYTAHESVFGKLQTRFSFYAGEGSGVLASTLSPDLAGMKGGRGVNPVLNKATAVAAVSPVFRLEIHPELENASPQSLVLNGVKVVQGYASGLTPHTLVHVAEVKAELDILTLLLSREWISHCQFNASSGTHSALEAAVGATAQQAALALASAAPSEAKVIVVLGEGVAGQSDGQRSALSPAAPQLPARKALLVRVRLSQPEGRVGLVVTRVHLGLSRQHSASPVGGPREGGSVGGRDMMLYSDVHLAIHQVTSLADWEHLSCDCGFYSLIVRGDVAKATSARTLTGFKSAGVALIVRKMRFKCKRDDNDALKLEVDGSAAAARGDESGCQMTVETMNVDAYISSSTVKTINRLRQLQSRLIRGLRPQVERLLLAEIRRDGSRHSASLDSFGFAGSRGSSLRPPAPAPGTGLSTTAASDAGESVASGSGARPAAEWRLFPGRVLVSGDQLVVTMHGFSFDANQPQAKLLFKAYDVDYEQRCALLDDMDLSCVPEALAGDVGRDDNLYRLLSLRYGLLDVQYSDQRQHAITVMSLPDPHLSMRVVELQQTVVVDFVTRFDSPVETSPSVSHYDYLRQLLSLYRSVTITSLARTLSAMDPTGGVHGADHDGEGATTSSAHARPQTREDMPGPAPPRPSPAGSEHTDASDRESTAPARVRWGGRRAVFKNLVFAPLLNPLGDLTPDVSVVLSWLGVGGIEALPGGLYDILMLPLSHAVDHVAHAAKLGRLGSGG